MVGQSSLVIVGNHQHKEVSDINQLLMSKLSNPQFTVHGIELDNYQFANKMQVIRDVYLEPVQHQTNEIAILLNLSNLKMDENQFFELSKLIAQSKTVGKKLIFVFYAKQMDFLTYNNLTDKAFDYLATIETMPVFSHAFFANLKPLYWFDADENVLVQLNCHNKQSSRYGVTLFDYHDVTYQVSEFEQIQRHPYLCSHDFIQTSKVEPIFGYGIEYKLKNKPQLMCKIFEEKDKNLWNDVEKWRYINEHHITSIERFRNNFWFRLKKLFL